MECSGPNSRWRLSRTIRISVVVALMFVTGVAAVGITHQASWLASSPERILAGGRTTNRHVSQYHLKQIVVAAHDCHANEGNFPVGAIFGAEGVGLHGWHSTLLPYLEEDALFKIIDFQKPWNHPANLPAMRTEVKFYRHPGIESIRDDNNLALSHYASNVRVLGGTRVVALKSIVDGDGTSNTLFFGEINSNFKPWGHPVAWRDPALGINTHPEGFGSPRKGDYDGAQFAFVDGSVRFISAKVSHKVLMALSTPDGGEKIPAGLE